MRKGRMSMAHMYPDHLDEQVQSQAERTLYTALGEQLDDSYVVFHHVGWLAHDKRKHPQDGEAEVKRKSEPSCNAEVPATST
jgi:hypothetical protein